MKLVIALMLFGAFACFMEAKPAQERMELVEGDMLLTNQQKEVYNQHQNGRVRRAAIINRWLWPRGIVPYTFHRSFDYVGRKLAKRAMAEWEDKTCLKFKRRTNERKYVTFKYSPHLFVSGCYSTIGRYRAGQPISLGKSSRKNCGYGVSLHEIGHAIGLFHEQARPDRDRFVDIIWNNIREDDPEIKDQFRRGSRRYIDSRNHNYDYASIMHYPRKAFSKGNRDTIVPKRNFAIGQRKGLSNGDIAQVKDMYKCNDNDESQIEESECEGEDEDSPKCRVDEEDSGDDKDGPRPGDVEV